MIDASVPNKSLPTAAPTAALAQVAEARSLAKYAALWPTPFYLSAPIPSLRARSRFKPFQAILPHIDRALIQFTLGGWSLTTAQRLAELTSRHTSKCFLSDCTIGPNNFPGISRPALDESKDCMVPPVWENSAPADWGRKAVDLTGLEEEPLLKEGHRVRGIQRSK
jgi:hypothetical protein